MSRDACLIHCKKDAYNSVSAEKDKCPPILSQPQKAKKSKYESGSLLQWYFSIQFIKFAPVKSINSTLVYLILKYNSIGPLWALKMGNKTMSMGYFNLFRIPVSQFSKCPRYEHIFSVCGSLFLALLHYEDIFT